MHGESPLGEESTMPDSDDARRSRAIAAMNRRAPPPTPEHLEVLKEHGADSWGEYVADLADNNGASYAEAFTAFELLGVEEAFDGLVSTLESMAE